MFLWQLAVAGPESKRKEMISLGACEVTAKITLGGFTQTGEAPKDNTSFLGVLSALANSDELAEPKVYPERLATVFLRALGGRSAAGEAAAASWLASMASQTRCEAVAKNVCKAAEAEGYAGYGRLTRVLKAKTSTDRVRLDVTRCLSALLAAASKQGHDARVAANSAACFPPAPNLVLRILAGPTPGLALDAAPPMGPLLLSHFTKL